MKYIFWLLLGSFQDFLIYGNDELESGIIDTVELDESSQQIVKTINDTETRNCAKKSLWKIEKEIREQKDKIREQDDKLREQDDKIREQEDKIRENEKKLNNSMHNFVTCAMIQIKGMLQLCYQKNAKNLSVPPWNEAAYEFCKDVGFGYENADLYALTERDAEWIEQYDNRSRAKITHKTVFVEEVLRYKKGWLKYLYTEEGSKLMKLIGRESITVENRCALSLRFSINMARLYKIASVFCRKLYFILWKINRAEPKKTYLSHLRDLIPKWSCTGEQIYFYKKLLKFMIPTNPDAYHGFIGYEFGKVNISLTAKREVTFFVPYTREGCSVTGSEKTVSFNEYSIY